MKKLMMASVVSLGALACGPAMAETARYDCTFEKGSAWNYADGAFRNGTETSLSFEISNISRQAQTAKLKTDAGGTDLKLVAAIDALHFIEVTVSGYLNLTTIYGNGDRVPAVHSRHLGIVGQPVGGQLTGFCDRKKS